MSENSAIAYIFPGQGSQKVGMGKDLYEAVPSAKHIFDIADNILGFKLSKLCFEGPEEELRSTINAQPALVTMSLACYEAAKTMNNGKINYQPAFLAGHSLGEYTALAVGQALDYPTAIYLARERGRLMFEAGQKVPGAMAAILGLDENVVEAVCLESGTWLANINCPGQLVISGSVENIGKAIALAKSRGALRALPLQVSGAFHSPLMQPAADGLAEILNKITFHDSVIPVIANTNALPISKVADIKKELLEQLCHSVQWQKSVEFMIAQATNCFIEIGSGNVLNGLIKRINKNVKSLNISGTADLMNIQG